jgi:protein tyrosine/serine phosphatase
LSNVDDGPTVVHCVAGKDRTGLISALTLALLNVSDEEIAADYELTERAEASFAEWLRRNDPEYAHRIPPPFYVQTPAQAMRFTLAELRERHGSVREYVGAHGVTDSHVAALAAGLT